jgi:hypothetical protein
MVFQAPERAKGVVDMALAPPDQAIENRSLGFTILR